MSLSEFILSHMEEILVEWERYASTIPAAHAMDATLLRNSAEAMLRAIATEMVSEQSTAQQEAKSRGQGDQEASESLSEIHAGGRQAEGFSLNDVVSEYRALRASVVRLWTRELTSPGEDALYELIRFDEGIDAAWSKAIARFKSELDHSRELFLAVLGHDLRNPLGSVLNSANYLLRSEGLTSGQTKAASNITRGGIRLQEMISDLLDVTRTRLGQALPIAPQPIELTGLCEQVAEEARAYHPDHVIDYRPGNRIQGQWDRARLAQMVSNVVENAIRHGAPDKPVNMIVTLDRDDAVLAIHNFGYPIPPAMLHKIFEPLVQVERDVRRPKQGLGLGLYIARQIAEAQGGSINVESSAVKGTTFTIRLPCVAKGKSAG